MESPKARIANTVLKKKNRVVGPILVDFKTTVSSVVLAKEYTDQWNRIESLETDTYKYSQLYFTKEQWQCNGAKTVFSTNGAGIIGHLHLEK